MNLQELSCGFFHVMTRQTQGLIAINIAAIIFGSAALYGKLNVSPYWIVSMRAAFASVVLLVLAIARRELKNPRKQWKTLVVTGAILAFHWLTFFFSVQLSGIAVATLTFAAFPLFTLIIESIKNKRRVKPVGIAASIMIIVAVSILVRIDTASPGFLYGTFSGIVSALLFAVFGVLSKQVANVLPTLSVSLCQNLVVFVVLIPMLPYTQHPQATDWGFLLLLGVVTTALMHQLYFYSLQRLSAGTCSGFVALEPVYAILFAAILFHEPVTFTVLVSATLIIAASFLILKS